MRSINRHKRGPLNEKIDLQAIDEAGAGGANRQYRIEYPVEGGSGGWNIQFQLGDPQKSINGVSNEVFLALLEDRLTGFESGELASVETVLARKLVTAALEVLKSRTSRRVQQGTICTDKEVPTSSFRVSREGNRVIIAFDDLGNASMLASALKS